MVITALGGQYAKIAFGEQVMALNPPRKDSALFKDAPRFGADVVLISAHHPDFAGSATVTFGEKEPFVIEGPGDYEIQGLFIKGVASEITIDKKRYLNTTYTFEQGGMRVTILGAVNEDTLSPEAKALAGQADILFIGISGAPEFEPAAAYQTAVSADPHLIIPLYREKSSLTRFLKEGGQEKNELVEKITLKRKDLDGKEAYIVPLTC